MIAALALALAPPATLDRSQIETIVREYILAHPEILPEAMERLQARELQKAIADNHATVFTPFASAWEGVAEADVTIAEFFDYNCGYCRASQADVRRLLQEDAKLRVVHRHFPVLGGSSRAAAQLALRAAHGERYTAVHRALFATGGASEGVRSKLERSLGRLDEQPEREIEAEIARNLALARPLGITGTPAWVIGNRVISGAVGYDRLKQAITEARAERSGRR